MFDFLIVYGANKRPLDSALLDFFLNHPPRSCTFAYTHAVYLLSELKDRLFLACSSGIHENLALCEAENKTQTAFFDGCLSQTTFNTDIRTL